MEPINKREIQKIIDTLIKEGDNIREKDGLLIMDINTLLTVVKKYEELSNEIRKDCSVC